MAPLGTTNAPEQTLQRFWIDQAVAEVVLEYPHATVVFDDERLELEIDSVPLPTGWLPETTQFKMSVATCPYSPPYPLFVRAGLTKDGQRPRQYLTGPDADGWCSFHVGIDPAASWEPSWDVFAGDTLVTYLRSVMHALTEGI